MDANLKWTNEKRIERTIKALEKNNMNGYLVKTKEDIIKKIQEIVEDGSKISCGGSMSLQEAGVMELLRSGKYNFLDREKAGLSKDDIREIYRESFTVDAYFTSSNAVTEEGELYNVDGNGNRVAAMLYGPDKVIVVCGVNKIVKNLDEAIKRTKYLTAPANAKRLNRKTPCANVGKCMDCSSLDRICNEYTLIKRQVNKERIHVIFLNDELGY